MQIMSLIIHAEKLGTKVPVQQEAAALGQTLEEELEQAVQLIPAEVGERTTGVEVVPFLPRVVERAAGAEASPFLDPIVERILLKQGTGDVASVETAITDSD